MKDHVVHPIISEPPTDGSPEAVVDPEETTRIQQKLDDYQNKVIEQQEKEEASLTVREQFVNILQNTILPVLEDFKQRFKSEVLRLDYICVQSQGDPSVVMRLLPVKESDALTLHDQPHLAFRLLENQGKVTINPSHGKAAGDSLVLALEDLTAETVHKSLAEWLEASLDNLAS